MDDHRSDRMHAWGPEGEALAGRVFDWALDRARQDPAPLNSPRSAPELAAGLGEAITAEGLGPERAFDLFAEVIAPSCMNCGHPRYFSFIPYAPTNAATVFDIAVSASGIFADWWLEGSGAIFAENQALRWIADLAGMPASAGGVFVSGGTQGNLNGLFVAREAARFRGDERGGEAVALCGGAHSSLRLVARVLDLALDLRVYLNLALRAAPDVDGQVESDFGLGGVPRLLRERPGLSGCTTSRSAT